MVLGLLMALAAQRGRRTVCGGLWAGWQHRRPGRVSAVVWVTSVQCKGGHLLPWESGHRQVKRSLFRALHPGLCIPRSLRGGCGDTASPPPDPLNSTGQSRSALGQNVLISCFSSPAGTWPMWSPAVPRVLCKAAGAAGGFQRQQSSSLPWSCHSSHLISCPALFLRIPFLTCLICLI